MSSWLERDDVDLGHTPIIAGWSSRRSVTVGSTLLDRAVRHFTTRLVGRSEVQAEVVLDLSRTPGFDAFAPLQITSHTGDSATPIFSGTIQDVVLDGETATITATNMSNFKELGAPPLAHREMGAYDMLYMFARTSGFEQENINFQMETRDINETIEVALFITDCHITEPVSLSSAVRLVPNAVHLDRFGADAVPPSLRSAVASASAVAVTYVDGEDWLYEAEELGCVQISEAIEWITLQLRNGFSRDQELGARSFSRTVSRGSLRDNGIVLVTGLSTGRSWLRDRSTPVVSLDMDARVFGELRPLPSRAHRRPRLAAAALARAADEDSDSMARLAALWQALEYYAADASIKSEFSAARARSIRRNATKGLEGEHKKRVLQALQNLNEGSLLMRIAHVADEGGVTFTDSDRACLKALRNVRNNSVHGGAFEPPTRDDVNQGVSIAARLILHSK